MLEQEQRCAGVYCGLAMMNQYVPNGNECLVDETRQYMLRVVLNDTNHPLLHHVLKKAVFSHFAVRGDEACSSVFQTVKCAFDVAVVSLLEEGLLVRSGHGNWAQYGIPSGRVQDAMRLADFEFHSNREEEDYVDDSRACRLVYSPENARILEQASRCHRDVISLGSPRRSAGLSGQKRERIAANRGTQGVLLKRHPGKRSKKYFGQPMSP